MFAQRTSGAFVCLRCQFSLAARQQPRRPAFQTLRSATPCANVSTRARLCQEHVARVDEEPNESSSDALGNVSDEANDATAAPTAPAAPADAPEEFPAEHTKIDIKTKDRPRMSSRPLKIRGRKGSEIRESSAPLTKQVLGAPSEVIILREALTTNVEAPRRQVTKYDEMEPEKRKKLRESIQASIAGNIAVSGQEDVDISIDKMRPVSLEGPNYPVFLLRRDLDKIRDELAKGYTVPQLKRYFKIKQGQRTLYDLSLFGKDASNPQAAEPKNKKLLFKSKWVEGMHEATKRLADIEVPTTASKGGVKKRLLDQIIFDVWDVGIIEENEVLGQMEIELRPWQLELLMAEGQFNSTAHLDRIGNARNAKFEVYTSINMIRVTSTRPNAEQAITDIENVLQTTERQKFAVTPFAALTEERGFRVPIEAFRTKDIADAARLSSTVIRSDSNSELLIRGTSKDSIEDARRILLSMVDPWTRSKNQVIFDNDAEGFLHAQGLENDLAYRYRQRPYARFTLPVSRERKVGTEEKNPVSSEGAAADAEKSESAQKEDGTSSSESVKTDASNLAESLNLKTQVIEHLAPAIYDPSTEPVMTPSEEPKNFSESYWKSQPDNELKATLGKVLHHVDPPSSTIPQTLSALASSQNANPDRTFSHGVPSFSALLRQLTLETSEKANFRKPQKASDDSLIFRFIPSPWYSARGVHVNKDFPELHVEVRLQPRLRTASMLGMHLIVRENNADVLLPTKPTDIRFTARQLLYAQRPDKNEDILKFVQDIESNIAGTGQIRAPPRLAMSIPAWTVQNAHEYAKYRYWQDNQGRKELKMMYVFAGVEHRQKVRFLLDNERLRLYYTAVEAGVTGGRSGELAVVMKHGLAGNQADKQEVEGRVGELAEGGLALADLVSSFMSSRERFEKWSLKKGKVVSNWLEGISRSKRRAGSDPTKPTRKNEGGRRQDDFGGAREPDAFDHAFSASGKIGNVATRSKPGSFGEASSAAYGKRDRVPDAFDDAFSALGRTGKVATRSKPDAFDDAFSAADGKKDGVLDAFDDALSALGRTDKVATRSKPDAFDDSFSAADGKKDGVLDAFDDALSALGQTDSVATRSKPDALEHAFGASEQTSNAATLSEPVEVDLSESAVEDTGIEEQNTAEQALEGQSPEAEEQTLENQLASDQHVEEQNLEEQPVEEQTLEDQITFDQPAEQRTLESQPAVEQTFAEQPVVEEPVVEEPVVEQPVVEQPIVEQTIVEQTIEDQSGSYQPVSDQTAEDKVPQEETISTDKDTTTDSHDVQHAGIAPETSQDASQQAQSSDGKESDGEDPSAAEEQAREEEKR